jgi:hypothetical protein
MLGSPRGAPAAIVEPAANCAIHAAEAAQRRGERGTNDVFFAGRWTARSLAHAASLCDESGRMDAVVLLMALALGVIAFQVVGAAWRRAVRRRRILSRLERAVAGERLAAEQLHALGYEIVGSQVSAEYPVRVDREDVTVGVRADYLVQKGGQTYVVEVKTGQNAPRIGTPATRRQLLEYRVAFDVDGVLLFDAEVGRVRSVAFPKLDTRAAWRVPRWAWLWGVAVVIVAALAAGAGGLR